MLRVRGSMSKNIAVKTHVTATVPRSMAENTVLSFKFFAVLNQK